MSRILFDEEDGLTIERSDGTVIQVSTHRNAGGYFASLLDFGDLALAELRPALVEAIESWNVRSETWGTEPVLVSVLLSSLPDEEIDTKYTPYLDVWLHLTESQNVEAVAAVWLEGEDWTPQFVEDLLRPLFEDGRAAFVETAHYDLAPVAGSEWLWHVHFRPSLDITVDEAITLGRSAAALLEVADKGVDLEAVAALRIVRSGLARVLFGQPESDWLEVKARMWDLESVTGRIELAQDVSRFANGLKDALLLVGVASKKSGGRDVLIQGPGLALADGDVERVHKILDARIHPPIDGLEVFITPDGHGRQLLAILVKAQPEELKPFIVHGAIVDGKVEGGFFSIVRRRGEHSIPVSPESLHSMIAAGRALLRGASIGMETGSLAADGEDADL